DQRKLFLVDGDPLILPQPRLVRILERVRDRLPWVRQAGSYANAKAVARKSDAELAELRGLGLRVVHLGLESGDDETLRRMNKYGDAAFLLEQGLRVKAAGMRLFSTVLLGLAGPEGSGRHARATGRLLSRLAPDWTGALSLMLIPGTPLHGDRQAGRFVELGPEGLLRELGVLLAGIDVPRGQFFSNHASNHLPLRLRLPRDKDEALARIERALKGRETLRPEFSRRL
ncbi:MAG: radical SAM protein, partial [Desulfovibrionaceae bacterium]